MAEPLFVPKDTFDRQPALVFENVLAELPLKGCELQRNPLTGHLEYIAPAGMAFRMSGRFTLDSDQSDIALWGPPQASEDLQAARHAPKYDEDGSTYYDVDDDRAPVAEFVGHRLTVSVNQRFMGQPEPPRDDWVKHYGRRDSDHDRPDIEVHIFGQPQAWCETGLRDYVWQRAEGVHVYDIGLFPMPNAILNWQTPEARAEFEHLNIELIPYDYPPPVIQVVQRPARDDGIWEPSASGPGMSDDLLVLESDRYAPAAISLDDVAELAKQKSTVPLGYFESQYQESLDHAARLRATHLRRLSETLVVVEGSAPLSQAVSAHASTGWLERAMAVYDSRPRYDYPDNYTPTPPVSNCRNSGL